MKTAKYIIAFIIMISLTFPILAKKRANPIDMKSLTSPSSPSFVPHPYPKNRKEIIADLLYAIKRLYGTEDGHYFAGKRPQVIDIFLNLLDDSPNYKTGKILKVKNRHHGFSDNYYWIVLIEDNTGNNVAQILLRSDGLFIGSGEVFPQQHKGFILSEKEILSIISQSIGQPVNEKLLKRMELLGFGPGTIGSFFTPAWEVELKNGLRFYYSINKEMVYGVRENKAWKLLKNGKYESYLKHIPTDAEEFAFESVNDKIVIFKKYPRK
jgi:hypothetical protein